MGWMVIFTLKQFLVGSFVIVVSYMSARTIIDEFESSGSSSTAFVAAAWFLTAVILFYLAAGFTGKIALRALGLY